MKLMTLNTHSLMEKEYESKLRAFVEGVFMEKPDIIALQEVNQSQNAGPADPDELTASGYIPCSPCEDQTSGSSGQTPGGPPAIIRSDNHAFRLAKLLRSRGLPFQWTWAGAKTGYGRYDEGLALFSRLPVLTTRQFYITGIRDYSNWKTRKILGISVASEHGMEYFYSVHMGWWEDEEEPFKAQWDRICRKLAPVPGPVWLMGDFNSPAHIRGQGRDYILDSGWLDSYQLAEVKDEGITAGHAIDGWKERGELPGMRIDYIWTSRPVPVRSSRTAFNGALYPVVSDHFGIIAEYESGHCPLKGAE